MHTTKEAEIWHDRERVMATLRLTAGSVMISFAPVFVNLTHVGPTISAFYRMLFGGAVLLVIAAVRRGRLPDWRHLGGGALAGAFLALDLAVWHRSILYVGPGLATILANLQVFFFAGFGIVMLGERMTRRLAVAIPLAVAGLVLVFGFQGSLANADYRLGVVLGFLTAVLYAAYLVTLRHTRLQAANVDPAVTVAVLSVVAAALLGAMGWLEDGSFRIPDRQTWAALLGLGLVPQVVGWLLITSALTRIEASRAGLLLLLQPALAFVWDMVFFARATRGAEIAGAIITLGAIYLGMTGRATMHEPQEPRIDASGS